MGRAAGAGPTLPPWAGDNRRTRANKQIRLLPAYNSSITLHISASARRLSSAPLTEWNQFATLKGMNTQPPLNPLRATAALLGLLLAALLLGGCTLLGGLSPVLPVREAPPPTRPATVGP